MLKAIAKKIQLTWAFKGKDSQSLKNRLIKGAAGSFALKIVASGFTFIMSVMFARFLGTVGLGTYSYATTWVNLLSIPATLGIDQLMVREMAVYRAKSHWKLMRGLLNWSNLIVLGFSSTLTLIAIAVIWHLKADGEATIALAVALAMITLPIASLRNLRSGAMRGLDRVVLGQVPEALLGPVIIMVLTYLAYFAYPEQFDVFWLLIIKTIAISATFFAGAWWLWRSLPSEVHQAQAQYKVKQWLSAALPFMFLGALDTINSRIDIIMLGAIEGVAAVGVYTVIFGITRLAAFIHQASLGVLGPTVATLYSENKLKQMEQVIQKSILVVFLLSLLVGSIVIGFSRHLLLIFGAEFVVGTTAMNILIVGQIFNALSGPVGLVLNMTGYQNYTAIATAATATLNILLNALLIPQWGINGAAIATTTSLVAINIIKIIFVQKKLNISLYLWSIKSK